MEVKAINYEHDARLSIFLVPTTDVERTLLQTLWKHGELMVCNGIADKSGQGYAITTRKPEALQSNINC